MNVVICVGFPMGGRQENGNRGNARRGNNLGRNARRERWMPAFDGTIQMRGFDFGLKRCPRVSGQIGGVNDRI